MGDCTENVFKEALRNWNHAWMFGIEDFTKEAETIFHRGTFCKISSDRILTEIISSDLSWDRREGSVVLGN